MDEFRWEDGPSFSSFEYLHSGNYLAAWLDVVNHIKGNFRYAVYLVAETRVCQCETVEEAKRFVEAQYILSRGE